MLYLTLLSCFIYTKSYDVSGGVICHVFLVGPRDRSEMKSNETICKCLLQSAVQVGHVLHMYSTFLFKYECVCL